MAEDGSFAAIVTNLLTMFERDTVTRDLTPIDLGPYPVGVPSLSPEGDRVTYLVEEEPFKFESAKRLGVGQWTPDGNVPYGYGVGQPSALRYGPRRMFVSSDGGLIAQEYEDDAGWVAFGTTYAPGALLDGAAGVGSLSLMPDGLTLIFEVGAPPELAGIYFVRRPSLDAQFAAAPFNSGTVLSGSGHARAHLSDDCKQLFVLDTVAGERILRRYDLQ